MKFTHKKRVYYATCLQWTDANTTMVIELLYQHGCRAEQHGNELMLRWGDYHRSPSIEMMEKGSWLRLSQIGVLKVLTRKEMLEKYEDL